MRLHSVFVLSLLPLLGCHSCDEAGPPDANVHTEPAPAAPRYVRLASGLDPVHTLNRWLLLYRDGQSEGVMLAPYLAGDVTLVLLAGDPRAADMAHRFGAEPQPLEVGEQALLRPQLTRTRAPTALFSSPADSQAARILPAHAILIRLDGSLPGAGLAPDGFAWVAATRTDGGYVREESLLAYEGCVPTPARFLADLPVSDGRSHEVRATLSRVRVSFDGAPHDAFLFASQERHEKAEGKHGGGVGVYPTDEQCELSQGFALSFGDVVEQVDVVDDAAGQPSLLSIVLSEGDAELKTKLFRVGQPEAVFERDLVVGTPGPWPALSHADLPGAASGAHPGASGTSDHPR